MVGEDGTAQAPDDAPAPDTAIGAAIVGGEGTDDDRVTTALVLRSLGWSLLIGCAGVSVTSLAAQTVATAPPPLPPLDLGQTNILDGEGGPGRLFELITVGTANRLTNDEGDKVPGRNRQRVATIIVHPIFVSYARVFGAHPGVKVLVPLASVDNDFAADGSGRQVELGDATIAPFLQWSPSKPGRGSLSARLAVQGVVPTGDGGPVGQSTPDRARSRSPPISP